VAEESEGTGKGKQAVIIDLADLYKFEPEDLLADIKTSAYSNLAYIQVTHRDVVIDFFEMPGTKKDGKMVLPGTRVFMSFAAAQRLSEALAGILEKAHRDGGMEQYIGGGTQQDISTKVRQKRQTKST
jgi:rhodanese-related sulfurtransferase